MKILYKTVKGMELRFNVNIINYIKELTSTNARSLKLWEDAEFSLIDDNNNIVWTKQFKDITEKDLIGEIN